MSGFASRKPTALKPPFPGLDRFFIQRAGDGSCTFLCHDTNNYFCGLQNIKPEACKIWPFKVLTEPKYGEENLAAYDYRGLRFYVYGDDMCSGLRYGTPTWDFQHTTVKEFAELAFGVSETRSPKPPEQPLTDPSGNGAENCFLKPF